MTFEFDDIIEEIKDEIIDKPEVIKREIDDAHGYALRLTFKMKEYSLARLQAYFFNPIERILHLLFGHDSVTPVQFETKTTENKNIFYIGNISLKEKFRSENDIILFFRKVEEIRKKFELLDMAIIGKDIILNVIVESPRDNSWEYSEEVTAIWPLEGNYDVWPQQKLQEREHHILKNNFNIIYDVCRLAKNRSVHPRIDTEKIFKAMGEEEYERIVTCSNDPQNFSGQEIKQNIIDIDEPGFLSRQFPMLKDVLMLRIFIDIIPCGRRFRAGIKNVSIESLFEIQKEDSMLRTNGYQTIAQQILLDKVEIKKLTLQKVSRTSFMNQDELMTFHNLELVSKAVYLENLDTDVFLVIRAITNDDLSNFHYYIEQIIENQETLNKLRQFIRPPMQEYIYNVPSGIYLSDPSKVYVLTSTL